MTSIVIDAITVKLAEMKGPGAYASDGLQEFYGVNVSKDANVKGNGKGYAQKGKDNMVFVSTPTGGYYKPVHSDAIGYGQGSGPGGMVTNFKDMGDHYLLNGAKLWISNAPFAQVAVVWAKNEEGRIHGLIVERGMEGFSTKQNDTGV